MTKEQAEGIHKLAQHKGLNYMTVLMNPGMMYGLPDGYIVVEQHFESHRVWYGISPEGRISS